MKRVFILCILAMAIAIAGCNKFIEEPEQTGHKFRGVLEGTATKTYLDNQIRLRWTAGDYITIFEGITRNKKYMFTGETGDNAGDFEFISQGFGTGNSVTRHYAVYPYSSGTNLHEDGYITYTFPSTQNYAEGSVGLGANPMVAITADLNDMDLLFRNIGSFLRVNLYGTDQTVGSIVLTTNNGKAIAGPCKVTPAYGADPTCETTGTLSSVTLNCTPGITIGSTEAEATSFWIVIPPLTMEEGLTLTVNGFYGGSQTYTINSSIEFVRNQYKTMTRELSIPASDGNSMGVGGWGSNGNDNGGTAE